MKRTLFYPKTKKEKKRLTDCEERILATCSDSANKILSPIPGTGSATTGTTGLISNRFILFRRIEKPWNCLSLQNGVKSRNFEKFPAFFRPRFVPLGKLGRLGQQDDLCSKRKKPTPCPKTVESICPVGLVQIEIKVSIRSLESG